MTALSTGIAAGRRAFRDLGYTARLAAKADLTGEYGRAWAYYRNDEAVYASTYLTAYSLYKYTRLIYNPIPMIIDFYVDHIFNSGTSGFALDDGTQLVTPLLDSTPDELKAAVAQLDQWTNWQSETSRLIRYGAVTGNVLIEVDDDLEREKVLSCIVWPGQVAEIELDATGNVKAYMLEYKVYERARNTYYIFRKEVDSETIRYYRDDKIDRARADGGQIENPYGFTPAVWCKHVDNGGDAGDPAVWNITKVDEINSLASHQHDRTHKAIEAGKAIATDGDFSVVSGGSGSTADGGRITPYDTRSDFLLLKMPATSSVHDLDSQFNPALADPQIDRMLQSFERDYPELQVQEVIQNKAQVSGAALERMLAPSQAKLDRAFNNYAQQVIKLKQMQIAIAGWRLKSGDWKRRTTQQAYFAPFDLESYERGALNFGLKRSLLVQSTPLEEEELKAKRVELAKNLDGLVDERTRIIEAGYSEERADEILIARRSTDVLLEVAQ